MTLAVKGVSAGLGDRAHDTAERPTVLRRNSDGLHLHFLEIFEDGALPRLAVHKTICRHAVDRELVLGTAGAVHLNTALDQSFVNRRSRQRDRLEGASLRKLLKLLRWHVVLHDRAADVYEWGGFAGDFNGFGEAAHVEFGVEGKRPPQEDVDIAAFNFLESGDLERHRIAAGRET